MYTKRRFTDLSEFGPAGIARARLLDFGFSKRDVFTNNRVIFPHFHFADGGTRILFCHVEISSIRCRNETNLDDVCLSHVILNIVLVCPHGQIWGHCPIASINALNWALRQALTRRSRRKLKSFLRGCVGSKQILDRTKWKQRRGVAFAH